MKSRTVPWGRRGGEGREGLPGENRPRGLRSIFDVVAGARRGSGSESSKIGRRLKVQKLKFGADQKLRSRSEVANLQILKIAGTVRGSWASAGSAPGRAGGAGRGGDLRPGFGTARAGRRGARRRVPELRRPPNQTVYPFLGHPSPPHRVTKMGTRRSLLFPSGLRTFPSTPGREPTSYLRSGRKLLLPTLYSSC